MVPQSLLDSDPTAYPDVNPFVADFADVMPWVSDIWPGLPDPTVYSEGQRPLPWYTPTVPAAQPSASDAASTPAPAPAETSADSSANAEPESEASGTPSWMLPVIIAVLVVAAVVVTVIITMTRTRRSGGPHGSNEDALNAILSAPDWDAPEAQEPGDLARCSRAGPQRPRTGRPREVVGRGRAQRRRALQ
ncbi:hypothetical protein [Demequina litorisediminis]|uniref:hypothetical protein n=1 Tax=Demequina litorisediminis TaxID=1849022 RepID=UPI0024E0D5FC|nr:hypothetical protein [Demequina litorisediminis]